MSRKFFLLSISFLSCTLVSFAQYPTNGGVPSTWQLEESMETIKEHMYDFYTDVATNEKVAHMYIRGNDKKLSGLPKKVKFEGNTYTVRGISCLNSNLEEVTIPSTVHYIGSFSYPQRLTSVYFEKGSQLKTICNDAFLANTSLTTMFIPETVDSIGHGAFRGCSALRTVFLPRYVKYIGTMAFADCTSLWNVELSGDNIYSKGIPWDVADAALKEISPFAFSGCTSLEIFHIGYTNNNLTIGDYAFNNCSKLKNITTVNTVFLVNVGKGAFNDCASLVSVKSEGLDMGLIWLGKVIGEYAFSGCRSIQKLSFTSESDSIHNYAFKDCTSLKSIVFGGTYLGSGAFSGCKSLENASVSNLKYMGDGAFENCPMLKWISGLTTDVDYASNPMYSISNGRQMIDVAKVGYSYPVYARIEVKKQINEWQKKKEYESTVQWQARVTEETRNKKMQELLENAKSNYIKDMAPKKLECSIVSYDADAEIYKIKVDNIHKTIPGPFNPIPVGGDVYTYVQVPAGQAEEFKKSWADVEIEPTYCIANNLLGIASCEFKLNGKVYKSPILYDDETANVNLTLPPLDINVSSQQKPLVAQNDVKIDNSLDKQIPETAIKNDKTFAVVIGNENYQSVSKVQFAMNDAATFAAYCQKTLGLPEKNVRIYKDATYAKMLSAIKDIQDIAKAYKGDLNVIFYYAGHGIPNESTGDAFLLPVDADGRQTEVCYPLNRLYSELGGMEARSVTVFMDACFSGSERGNQMLASARGVAIKAKASAPSGNMVVFSAASGDETAYPYKEKGHGLFTYFLLKKLQETRGDVSLSELGNYIVDNVSKESVVSNGKSQTPTITASPLVADTWQSMRLR